MLSSFGSFGVKVFFVISGFLITTLLLNEEKQHGRISIVEFYFRRTFRIWPVAYAFILVVALLANTGVLSLPPHNLIYAATFTMNYAPDGTWSTGHLWSLAVEEQFYLVWPLIFLLGGTKVRRVSCLAVVVLAPILRITTYVFFRPTFEAMQASLLFVGDAIAIGCLLALSAEWIRNNSVLTRVIESNWFVVVPLLAVAMYATLKSQLWPKFHLALGDSISLFCIAATIWRVIHWNDYSSKVLNSRVLIFVGTISYSLYIWQQIFLNRSSTLWMNRFPQNVILAIGTAIISYRLIEMPFLRWRSRLSKNFAFRRSVVSRPESAQYESIGSVSEPRR
jgi:peptidoglycan/LPS O-acetylase OafA/YrhL